MQQNTGQASTETDLLVVVLDVNPLIWGPRATSEKPSTSSAKGKRRSSSSKSVNESAKHVLSFSQMLEHLLMFLNTYLITDRRNRIVIIGAWAGKPYVGTKTFLFFDLTFPGKKVNQTRAQNLGEHWNSYLLLFLV